MCCLFLWKCTFAISDCKTLVPIPGQSAFSEVVNKICCTLLWLELDFDPEPVLSWTKCSCLESLPACLPPSLCSETTGSISALLQYSAAGTVSRQTAHTCPDCLWARIERNNAKGPDISGPNILFFEKEKSKHFRHIIETKSPITGDFRMSRVVKNSYFLFPMYMFHQ